MPLTFNEILKACIIGHMPTVRHKKFQTMGNVTTIKDTGVYRGIGVTFPGKKYEEWYHDGEETDKFGKYISQLEIIHS